ncbi:hypothetical protein [Bacillus phage vB_BceS-M2]
MQMKNKQLEVQVHGMESVQLMEQVDLALRQYKALIEQGSCIVETYEQMVAVLTLVKSDDSGEVGLVHHMLDHYTIYFK